MLLRLSRRVILAALAVAALPLAATAAPYASGIDVSGTSVSFILNEPADTLTYTINGGTPLTLDGSTAGSKGFTLGSASDTFSIIAEKNDPVGYTIPDGGTRDYLVPDTIFTTHGLNEPSATSGFNPLTDVGSVLTRFNSPRGVAVSTNPNTPNFGTAYIVNSAAGDVTDGEEPPTTIRTLGDGIYALNADGSDGFGYGDTAQNPDIEGFPAFIASNSSGFRAHVDTDGMLYVGDWSDANGTVMQFTPDLTSGINAMSGFGDGDLSSNYHGSITSVYTEGGLSTGDFVMYTIDEDLTTFDVTGAGSTIDKRSLWRYDVGSGPLPATAAPTQVSDVLLNAVSTADVTRGADGKFYLTQARFQAAGSTTLYVLSPDGSTVLWDSYTASKDINNDPNLEFDILQYTMAVSVSPNQDWLALMLNGSDVAVIPLVDGIPQLEDRLIVDTDDFVNSGRDIVFDAAGNIHYVSSGQGRYTVLSPGGHTVATTSWDGSEFDFEIAAVTGGADDADFNGDGNIDGEDFLTWQRNYPVTDGSGSLATGDATGEGNIDGADLAAWQLQFGTTPPVAAVPEPATAALALLAAGGVALAAARRKTA